MPLNPVQASKGSLQQRLPCRKLVQVSPIIQPFQDSIATSKTSLQFAVCCKETFASIPSIASIARIGSLIVITN